MAQNTHSYWWLRTFFMSRSVELKKVFRLAISSWKILEEYLTALKISRLTRTANLAFMCTP